MPASQAFAGRMAVARPLSPNVVSLSQKAIGQIQRNAQSPSRSPQRLQPYPASSVVRSSVSPVRKEVSQPPRGLRNADAVTPRSQLRSWLTQRIHAVQIEISQFQNTRQVRPSEARDTQTLRRDRENRDSKHSASQALITPRRDPTRRGSASQPELRRETRSASPPAPPKSRMKVTHKLSERSLRQAPLVKRAERAGRSPDGGRAGRPVTSSPPRSKEQAATDRKVAESQKMAAAQSRESPTVSQAQEEAARRVQRFVRRWQKSRVSIASASATTNASAITTSPRQESEKICLSDSSLLDLSEKVSQPTPPQSLEAEGPQRMQFHHGRLRCVHHAAARIQRAWRVSLWRRCFVDFSRHQVGWLGSLSWLRRHHCLYGNELADSEDVRWWLKQRQGAPLDHQVDPWGFHRLQEHLSHTWHRSSKPSRSSSTAGPAASGSSRSSKAAKTKMQPTSSEGRTQVSAIFPARPLQAQRAAEGLAQKAKHIRLNSQCTFPGRLHHSSSHTIRRCGSGPAVNRVPDRNLHTLLRSGSGPTLQR